MLTRTHTRTHARTHTHTAQPAQDKDESSESLRQGIPVVSFSIGDTADFVMARTHDEVRPIRADFVMSRTPHEEVRPICADSVMSRMCASVEVPLCSTQQSWLPAARLWPTLVLLPFHAWLPKRGRACVRVTRPALLGSVPNMGPRRINLDVPLAVITQMTRSAVQLGASKLM